MYWSNTSNQYTSVEPNFVDPNYDAAGNMTRDHRGYMYAYNYDNGLTSVKNPSSATLSTFVYDALGRRISRSKLPGDGDAERFYVYSGQNVVEVYDVTGTRLRYFVHGPTYIDERVVMHDDASDSDYVYLMKDLYTVAGLADARGWLVESYDYDAYGQVRMSRHAVLPYAADYDDDGDVDDDDLSVFQAHHKGSGTEPNGVAGWRSDLDCDGDVDGDDYVVFAHIYNGDGQTPRGGWLLVTGNLASSRIENPYYFTGRRLDIYEIQDNNTPTNFTDDYAGLTLYHYRARTMNPVLGRFNQRDPFGIRLLLDWPGGESPGVYHPMQQYQDGMGLHEFVKGQPLVLVDPEGMYILAPPVMAAVVAAAACIAPVTLHLHWWADWTNDKYAHCVGSCRMSKLCGRLIAKVAGMGKEAVDELRQLLTSRGVGWDPADEAANLDGRKCAGKVAYIPVPNPITWIGGLFGDSCHCCCIKAGHPPH